MQNIKTTISGIICILFAIIWIVCQYFQIEMPVVTDISGAIALIAAGYGNIKSKDPQR